MPEARLPATERSAKKGRCEVDNPVDKGNRSKKTVVRFFSPHSRHLALASKAEGNQTGVEKKLNGASSPNFPPPRLLCALTTMLPVAGDHDTVRDPKINGERDTDEW